MVVDACNPSYLGDWGRRIAWTPEAEVAMSQDCAIALQPGQQEQNFVSKEKKCGLNGTSAFWETGICKCKAESAYMMSPDKKPWAKKSLGWVSLVDIWCVSPQLVSGSCIACNSASRLGSLHLVSLGFFPCAFSLYRFCFVSFAGLNHPTCWVLWVRLANRQTVGTPSTISY